ncbi:nucleotidyl transferase AbiEii/AbiGii toxin family protein [Patescibacteria group bacterium]|nr:nucleotidyl transferase AbiEii/AbiGii toxin family protein [Patescibacteria group bacterium]MBU1472662.1 nucleotidyl transferase AbiEii/AbiGii toxin family protein [Patescibacteria group bacterium]MBU2459900.1 nucleotidyl transferase AbiEii/AbiGii toxin family protein [Patescibacteria group bacterium]MBU2544710.1 nucleotidyl transferase AbiEii/AbiGii toxin family protein [Patescibacteria group bacterium]
MEQTMAKAVGFTKEQKQFFNVILGESYFLNDFYLSGGTALNAWYLHHRESYDLDFFTDHPFDYDKIIRWTRQSEHALGYTSVRFEDDYGFLMCFFRFSGGTVLKVDFHHYASVTLKKGFVWRGLMIDSLYDITVNKFRTIATIPRTRDYVDYYCIFQHTTYPLKRLMSDVAKKFREAIDPLQLAKNFLKVVDCTDMPIMRIPFDQTAMISFYQQAAKQLRSFILA